MPPQGRALFCGLSIYYPQRGPVVLTRVQNSTCILCECADHRNLCVQNEIPDASRCQGLGEVWPPAKPLSSVWLGRQLQHFGVPTLSPGTALGLRKLVFGLIKGLGQVPGLIPAPVTEEASAELLTQNYSKV